MKKITLIYVFSILFILPVFAQHENSLGTLPPFTKWYQNPLGVYPLALHTGNGLYIPAIAATAVLIFTEMDSSISKRLSFYDDLGVSFGYYASKTTVFQNNTGILYDVRRYLTLGAEFSTVHVLDIKNNTWGIGLRPFVRFYAVRKDNINLFFQSGAGLILFADTYPKPSGFFGDNREGTKLNGSPKYGFGTEFRINKNISGQAGVWHIHFSNGNHPSSDRNPGHDGNGFSIGVIYRQ